MKKTFLSFTLFIQIIILSALYSEVWAILIFTPNSGISFVGTYDPNVPGSALVKLDLDGNGTTDNVFYFPPNAKGYLDRIRSYKDLGYGVEIEYLETSPYHSIVNVDYVP